MNPSLSNARHIPTKPFISVENTLAKEMRVDGD
jgi:hypothetical protein